MWRSVWRASALCGRTQLDSVCLVDFIVERLTKCSWCCWFVAGDLTCLDIFGVDTVALLLSL
jgi:hypothetical protein